MKKIITLLTSVLLLITLKFEETEQNPVNIIKHALDTSLKNLYK